MKLKASLCPPFRDGNYVKSLKKVLLPAAIGKVPITIETEIVAVNIPLLARIL